MTEHTKCHLVDMELAQYVMGWVYVEPHIAKVDPPGEYTHVYSVGDFEMGGPYVYCRGVGCGDFDRWSPTEYDRDALDVVKQLQNIPRHVHLILHPTGECTCTIDPVWVGRQDGEQACSCTAPTLRQAICGAAEKWIEMRGEDTDGT